LVFNNTFVIPARFFGKKSSGGRIEGLLLQTPGERARVWIKGRVMPGDEIAIDEFGPVKVLGKFGKQIELSCLRAELAEHLKTRGTIPIPPYIVNERRRRSLRDEISNDRGDYQSIFAKEAGGYSVAAPTASLHFDEGVLNQLHQKGIQRAEVSLHIGEGTFAPVEVEDFSEHRMHSEEVAISETEWEKILEAKKRGNRIFAVGTTVCRSLEAAVRNARPHGTFWTDLFIKPPYEFKMVDALITNFHWPDSTLIVLVASFLEAENGRVGAELKHLWRQIYDEAVGNRYRFFSYGDGMLIL
jgi:S-adenosylmethionine:tRNA ribosyltransferase-isomerase